MTSSTNTANTPNLSPVTRAPSTDLSALETSREINSRNQRYTTTANAIEDNILSTATSAIELASAMAPDNNKVQQLSRRVANLPQLIEAMQQGEKLSALEPTQRR